MDTEQLPRAAEAPDFLLDKDVGAMLNTNENALAAYRKQREHARRNSVLALRVDVLESKLDTVLALLTQVLNK